MNINLNNYEAYFLDYHEGTLSPTLVKELLEFVAIHPELKQELENFEPITLMDSEGILFEQKEKLKKQLTKIDSSNFEEYAVEYVEGTLPLSLQKDLQIFISQNPGFKKELDLYARTKLQPDTSLVFDDKISLKRKQNRPAVLFYWSAAASVAIIVIAYFMLNRIGAQKGNTIVKYEQLKDSNIIAKQTTKQEDINSASSNKDRKSPTNNTIKNSFIAIGNTSKKLHVNRIVVPNNLNAGSPGVVINRKANNIHLLPDLTQKPIPLYAENPFVMPPDSLQGMAFINEWIMKYNSNDVPAQEDTIVEPYNEKSGSKFLFLLAKITCKGLHKITGQHIRMEKKFDSDTNNIIAYQLDLGKKTIDFPVKE